MPWGKSKGETPGPLLGAGSNILDTFASAFPHLYPAPEEDSHNDGTQDAADSGGQPGTLADSRNPTETGAGTDPYSTKIATITGRVSTRMPCGLESMCADVHDTGMCCRYAWRWHVLLICMALACVADVQWLSLRACRPTPQGCQLMSCSSTLSRRSSRLRRQRGEHWPRQTQACASSLNAEFPTTQHEAIAIAAGQACRHTHPYRCAAEFTSLWRNTGLPMKPSHLELDPGRMGASHLFLRLIPEFL